MSNCSSIDTLVTPYVDGELGHAERSQVEQHIRACPRCHTRVTAEQAVHELLRERKPAFCVDEAPATLRSRCAQMAALKALAARDTTALGSEALTGRLPMPGLTWRRRAAPFAAAGALVVVVGGAFLYRATESSPRVMAVELVADHMKCFAINAVLGTHQSAETVQSSIASGFGWSVRLPAGSEREGLELVGSRRCLYGEGKVAHIMYRHNGRPVSLFMLPRSARTEDVVDVLGHECAIWSSGDRTMVLVTREGPADVQRLAAFVRGALR